MADDMEVKDQPIEGDLVSALKYKIYELEYKVKALEEACDHTSALETRVIAALKSVYGHDNVIDALFKKG